MTGQASSPPDAVPRRARPARGAGTRGMPRCRSLDRAQLPGEGTAKLRGRGPRIAPRVQLAPEGFPAPLAWTGRPARGVPCRPMLRMTLLRAPPRPQADDAFTPVWTKLSQAGEPPSKRSGHSLTEVNGSGFLFGGEAMPRARPVHVAAQRCRFAARCPRAMSVAAALAARRDRSG